MTPAEISAFIRSALTTADQDAVAGNPKTAAYAFVRSMQALVTAIDSGSEVEHSPGKSQVRSRRVDL